MSPSRARLARILAAHSRMLPVATLAAFALALAASAAPAAAQVETVEGTKVGLQHRDKETILDGLSQRTLNEEPTANTAVESFADGEEGPVMHQASIYAIFWDPQDYYHGDWQEGIGNFFNSLGVEAGAFDDIFSVQAQYADPSGKHAATHVAYLGSYIDTDRYPEPERCENPNGFGLLLAHFPTAPTPNCITDAHVRTELSAFITAHNLPRGMSTIYDVFTPPGVAICFGTGGEEGHCSEYNASNTTGYENSFCSYHGAIIGAAESETILYDMIPWTAGGQGDAHLAEADRTNASACQDGGFNPENGLRELTPIEQEPNQLGIGPDGTYDHALTDILVNQIAIEEQDTVTDPLLNAWQDSAGNEATDECRNFFAPKTAGGYAAQEGTEAGTLATQSIAGRSYYLQEAFDFAAVKLPYPGVPCIPGIRLSAQFDVPTPVNPKEIVGFDGMESEVTLNWSGLSLNAPSQTYAKFTWNFGDGTPTVTGYGPGSPQCAVPANPECAATAFHEYAEPGTYFPTLTVTDAAGDPPATTMHEIVVGAVGSSSKGGGGGGGGGGGSGGSGGGGGGGSAPGAAGGGSAGSSGSSGGGSSATTYPPPSARAAAASSSLRSAIRHGLMVSYSVNEQVAGVIEVLLNARTAKHLHVHGPVATGLPSGFPTSLVIGRAVLVTRSGGNGAVRLKLSKATANALRKVRRLELTLRVMVRNASRTNPASTSLLSAIVLHG
jgi:PKD domain